MVQPGTNSVKDCGDMFAHLGPVRTVTGELYFTRFGKESLVTIGHDLHDMIGETPLQ